MRSVSLRVVGVVLLAIPFVPILEVFGEVKGATAYVPPGEWALGLAIFGMVAYLVSSAFETRIVETIRAAFIRLEARRPAVLLVLGVGILAAVLGSVSWFVFRHRPQQVDSVAQLFQAKIFAARMTEAPLPPETAFFTTLNMVFDSTGWYAQFPPGHSLLLTPGVWLGVPWLVPVLLTLGTATMLVMFASTAWDQPTAILTGGLLLVCPFFWFMGASFMNHVSTIFFVSVTMLCLLRWESSGGVGWATLAGGALGCAFLARPLTALVVGLVLAFAALLQRRGWGEVVAGLLSFAAVGSLYLLYNAATTGDPLVPGYIRLWGGAHGLGFHLSPWGEIHTLVTGARNELLDLSLLNVFLFEWPIPSLLPLGVALAAGWLGGDRWVGRLVVAFLALPLAYLFYWHRDAFLGPRYLYAAVAFLVPLSARALVLGWRYTRQATVGEGAHKRKLLRPVDGGVFMVSLVGLCSAYAMLWGIPQRFTIYATGMSSMKVDVVDRAEAAGLEPGVVFVATSWGNRLLAEMYGMGVPAPLAERVYRSSDHCRVQEIVDRAEREGWPLKRLESELSSAMVPRETLVAPVRLNGDPTLLLTPDEPLTERCVEELRHDGPGYTVYVPHLVENDPRLEGPWIVARDLRERNARLSISRPDLPTYRYRPGGFERLP